MKKFFFAGFGVVFLSLLIVLCWAVYAIFPLPDVSSLKHYRPPAATQVLDSEGRVLTEFFDRKYRIWVPISSLPDIVIKAVVTAEDDTFFNHQGVNYKATWEALVHDVQRKRFARGGSTITQQMIKNVLLTKEKTLTRKLREYILARKAEEILTKRQILQLYMNEVEWGDSVYGIEAASRFYFDKHSSELSPAEAALLAGMLPNPRYYNPLKRQEQAMKRQKRVLFNMRQARLITEVEYEESLRTPLALRHHSSGSRFSAPRLTRTSVRPCYHSALEKILLHIVGDQKLYRGGLTVSTTIDRGLQDEMRLLEAESSDPKTDGSSITVISRNGKVKALVCSTSLEDTIRERLKGEAFAVSDYDVKTVSLSSVSREQIIQKIEGGRK